SKKRLILFALYFFVLRPSPTRILDNALAVRLFDIISIILVIMLTLLLIKGNRFNDYKIKNSFLLFILLLFWSVFSVLISALVLNRVVSWLDLMESTRYFYYFVLLIFGYIASKYITVNSLIKHLSVALIITVGIALLQFFNPFNFNELITYIYTDAKLK